MYTRSGAVWSQEAKLVPPLGSPGRHFGWEIAISDGTMVISEGEAPPWIYRNSGSGWESAGVQIPLPALAAGTYPSVALLDGTLVVGVATEFSSSPTRSGVVRVFEPRSSRTTPGWDSLE